jgi:hypothetical protein
MGIEQCISEHGVLLRLVRLISNDTVAVWTDKTFVHWDKEKRPLFKRPFEELCDTWWCRNYVISVWFQLELQALPPEVLSSELLPQALPALVEQALPIERYTHQPRAA